MLTFYTMGQGIYIIFYTESRGIVFLKTCMKLGLGTSLYADSGFRVILAYDKLYWRTFHLWHKTNKMFKVLQGLNIHGSKMISVIGTHKVFKVMTAFYGRRSYQNLFSMNLTLSDPCSCTHKR